MFDDVQPKKTGQVPVNLPITEPEDIFSGAKDLQTDEFQSVPAAPIASTSALDAGVLKPRQPLSETQTKDSLSPLKEYTIGRQDGVSYPATQPLSGNSAFSEMQGLNQGTRFVVPPQQMNQDVSSYSIKEPLGSKKAILWIIIGVIVIVLGAGSAWMYFTFIQNGENGTDFLNSEKNADNSIGADENANTQPTNTQAQNTEQQDEIAKTPIDVDQSILFGQPIDTDGDGLDDVREVDLRTDPLNWDTDGDGLSDGDEVIIWKTDPLNPDTDGDGYFDGIEIKNGYSPTGPGKLFEVPTTTEANVQ